MNAAAPKPLTTAELRVFLDTWFCGCGSPDLACGALHDLLGLFPQHDEANQLKLKALANGDEGLRYLLLYTLDRFELIEHGGTVGGAWLTEKGKAVLSALQRETADGFKALQREHCAHGLDLEAVCADCRADTFPVSRA